MKFKSFIGLVLMHLALHVAAQNRVFYAGNSGQERFNDVHVLSDGTLLVAGQSQDLTWLPAGVARTELAATGLSSSAAGSVGFILHTNSDMSTLLRVVHFPVGTARDVFKIRSSELPGQATGSIFVSGSRDGASVDGYYLAKLNGNFVTTVPTALSFVHNVSASGDNKERQPWDVGGDGKIVYALGSYFATNWHAIQRLNASGSPEVVEYWHAHWNSNASANEWDGTPASSYTSSPPLVYSAVVMKSSRRGSLRSTNAADFALLQSDANGNTGRKGKFPDDYFFANPCALSGTNTCLDSGSGYTGYRSAVAQTQRVGAIIVDRRNNDIYFGYSVKSVLPDGNPDFEPAIVAMRADGSIKWWDRLYQETSANSSPDQYVDGMALDHERDRLVVLARTHGNNTINFWKGESIAQSPGLLGFQKSFSGTNGNIHLSWLGSFDLSGRLRASSYLGELVEGSTNFGPAHPDPLLGAWPNPNGGWPNLNTTRCGSNPGFSGEIAIFADGGIGVLCSGRRTLTTTDAFQTMPRPNQTTPLVSAWNQFVRVYSADLSTVKYSSLIVGAWDQSTGAGGDNTRLTGIAQANGYVMAVGHHIADSANPAAAAGANMPVLNLPTWGSAVPLGQSAIAARLTGTRLSVQPSNFEFRNGFE